MKRKALLFKFLAAIVFMALVVPTAMAQTTLKHSYTFDGNVEDAVSGVNGVEIGDITAINGVLYCNGGEVALSGKDINIPAYESITIETVFSQADAATGFKSLWAFGKYNPDVDWMGIDYLIYQPTRADNIARLAMETSNYGDPYNTETTVDSVMVQDTDLHHVVAVVTASDISLYFDGEWVGTTVNANDNALADLSNDTALIAGPVYPNDPKWFGMIFEHNIYEGAMDASTIADRYADYYTNEYTNQLSVATLADLSASLGELEVEFSPTDLEPVLIVPYGTTSVTLDMFPSSPFASVVAFDELGTQIGTDGVVTWDAIDEGAYIEIIVTSGDESTQVTYGLEIIYDDQGKVADLSSIDLSTGKLIGDFDPLVTDYSIWLPFGSTSVEITGVPVVEGATVTGGGSIELTDGTANVEISVESADASATKVYNLFIFSSQVEIGKEYYVLHETSGYVLTESQEAYNVTELHEPLPKEPTQFFKLVESGVQGQYFLQNGNGKYLTPTFDPVWDMVMKDALPTVDLDSARFEIDEFEPGRCRIVTYIRTLSTEDWKKYIAPNNNDLETWLFSDKPITDSKIFWSFENPSDLVDQVDRNLGSLSVDVGSISPDVARGVTDYYVVLPVGGVATMNVTAEAKDETSVVSGTGSFDVSGGSGEIVITVTADDNSTQDYTIHYMEDTNLTLMHSYTFSDGTAKDVVGGADGTVMGGSITDGTYTGAEVGDYIELPAEQIAINTYPSLTIEIYMADDEATTNANANTMVSYFGRTNDSNYGEDYMYTSMKCSSVLSVSDGGSPWSFEQGVNTGIDLHDDGNPHHLVTTISNDSLVFYVDGYVMDTAYFSGNNCIANLSNELAYLMKGGYTGDNTWLGSVLEYNIYSGVMSPQEIALGALDWPYEGSDADATLSDLTLDGVTIEGFNGAVLDYTIQVETLPIEVIPTAKAEGASAEITATATTIPGQTTILVTAVGGNTNTYTINYEVATAIGEVKDLGIKVYPTVSNGSFTVESEGASTVVTVYSLTGRVIDQFMTNSSTETFEVDQEGMYIVKVNSDGVTKLFKVIKK